MQSTLRLLAAFLVSAFSDLAYIDANAEALIDPNAEAIIERQIQSIIELEPLGKDFYLRTAQKAGKQAGTGCIMGGLVGALLGTAAGGPVGGAALAAKYCVGGGSLMALFGVVDAPFSHWSQSAQAAYRARKAYSVSFAWLDIDAFDIVGATPSKVEHIVAQHFRKCALRYHPDKIPATASHTHHENAAVKFANCKFAKTYILAFQRKYGVLDPEDTGAEAEAFLEKFAGAWAAKFGTSDGIGSLGANQVAEWLTAVQNHAQL
jgi:hypothetical protein